MNIKTIANTIVNISPQQKSEETKSVKSEHTQDRDANGQRQSEERSKKESFSEEEILKALNYLKELKGVKSNNLQVSYELANEVVVYLLKEPSGKVIKKLIGSEVWTLMLAEAKKGHLLDTAM